MFCGKCGKPIDETDAFCRGCGTSAKPRAPAATPGPQPAVASPVQHVIVQNPSAGKNEMVYGALLLVFGIFGSMFSCVAQFSSPGWEADAGTGLSIILMVTGAVIYFAGKTTHWYKSE
ncbi:MAG: zinc-ribbon domain-containing protein [Terriglobia bacterium]